MQNTNKRIAVDIEGVLTDSLATWTKEFGKHPTQKPLELLNRIITASSNDGDIGGSTIPESQTASADYKKLYGCTAEEHEMELFGMNTKSE